VELIAASSGSEITHASPACKPKTMYRLLKAKPGSLLARIYWQRKSSP
jgi:hypothetical protein